MVNPLEEGRLADALPRGGDEKLAPRIEELGERLLLDEVLGKILRIDIVRSLVPEVKPCENVGRHPSLLVRRIGIRLQAPGSVTGCWYPTVDASILTSMSTGFHMKMRYHG